MSIWRIWAIASNGFREVIRDRILYFIGFFTLLLILAWRLLPEISAGASNKIFIDFGLGAIGILSTIVAIFIGTELINKEIEKRTVLVLIPKPVSRAEFIIGKHMGLSAVLIVMVLTMTVIYLSLLTFSGTNYPLYPIILSIVFLLLELILITAVALLFGVFTSSILATLMSFGIYLMGNFSNELVELGKLSKNSNITVLTKNLYLLLPDLSRLNLRNDAVYGVIPNIDRLLSNGLYGIVYTIFLLAIAIWLFSQKEF
jgi:ABC-type transport system involved in multi-copper enzyme maturation permease subunit